MVVDGEATQLKWSTMDQREKASHGRGGAYHHRSRQTGRRTQLNSKINEVHIYSRDFCYYESHIKPHVYKMIPPNKNIRH